MPNKEEQSKKEKKNFGETIEEKKKWLFTVLPLPFGHFLEIVGQNLAINWVIFKNLIGHFKTLIGYFFTFTWSFLRTFNWSFFLYEYENRNIKNYQCIM